MKLSDFYRQTVDDNDAETGGWATYYYGVLSKVINDNNYTRVAEVGIGHGTHAKQLLKNTAIDKLYLIDPMVFYPNDAFANAIMEHEPEIAGNNFNEFAELIRNELSPWKDRYTWFRQPSLTITNDQIPDGSLDCVFVDGDHSYAAVLADLAFWWKKVGPGGQLLGDDFWMGDVAGAVNEFANRNGLKFDFLTRPGTSYKIYRFRRGPVSLRIVTSIYPNHQETTKTWNKYHSCIGLTSRQLNMPVLVYEKDDSLPFMTSFATDRNPPGGNGQIIRLDNTGSCDYAFLYHMYTNYDNLDDVTIFTKVNLDNPGNIDQPTFRQFVFEADRWDFSECGTFAIRNAWNLNLHYKNQQFLEFAYEEPSKRCPLHQRASDWYDHIFGGQPFPKTTINIWGHGPCFSVSREMIRRHPRSVYKYLMETYLSPYNRKDETCDFNPTHDHFVRFWKLLFTHGVDARVKPSTPHSLIEPNPEPLPPGTRWVSPNPKALHLRVLETYSQPNDHN